MRKQTAKKRKKVLRRRLLLLLCAVAVALGAYATIRRAESREPVDNLGSPNQIAYNRTAKQRSKKDIQYIVVHDTANTERGADAQSHFVFFNRSNQGSSADFFVDDEEILQVNDFYSYYTWHCGDGNGKSGITNQNSVGVEICVNRDGNYRRAVANAVTLVKRLMAELEIDAEHVVRHYDASGKACPGTMEQNDWKGWEEFQKKLKA